MTHDRSRLILLGIFVFLSHALNIAVAEPQAGLSYSIQNIETEEMMDVRLGSTEPGAEIWAFQLNHTDAQIFRFAEVGGSEGATFEIISNLSGHLVTLNVRLNLMALEDSQMTGFANICLLYTSPSPRDKRQSRMPSSA